MLELTAKEMEVRPNTIADVKVDASFRKIAKNAICFHVWKIDDDRLEAVPKGQFGTFFNDCAYIVYAASPVGTYVNQDTITRETKKGSTIARFIHFWLGEHVSEQKRSNVAYKIQELDSYFGNMSTEYRETQSNESARFLSYFKRGLTIRSGTLAASAEGNRLFQLNGRKWLRCIEMEDISWNHFSADYIMLLKTQPHIYLWMGRSSSIAERYKAIDLAMKMKPNADDIIIVDDGYEQSMPEKQKTIWNTFLPLKDRVVSQIAATNDKQQSHKMKIYKCGYKGTRLHLDQLDVVIPSKDDLSDSTSVYVLDSISYGVWLWVGNLVTLEDSISAMGNGRAFVKKKKYPNSTPVVRVIEGHEPIEFIRLFPSWNTEWNDSTISIKPLSLKYGHFDSITLCQRPKMAAETQLIDNGSGEREIYRFINSSGSIQMPNRKLVAFSTDSCYVVLYTVLLPTLNSVDEKNIGVKYIIYQWNGSETSAEAIKNAENFAKTRFDANPRHAMLVQMCEFDETPHFLQIFNGKLIILMSKRDAVHSSNINGNNIRKDVPTDTSLNELPGQLVLKVCGNASFNSKAVEVYPLSSISSKECYIIKTNHIWVWCGQSSTGDAREMAKNIGALLGENSLVLEGNESQEFMLSITPQMHQSMVTTNNTGCSYTNGINGINSTQNGSIHITSHPKLQQNTQLFLIWMQHNKVHTQEIVGFEQCDLSPECIYVLDAGLITYIWLGNRVSHTDRGKYFQLTQWYWETVPIARRPTSALAVIRQNDEPNVFKGFFENWNHDLWKDYETYEQKRKLFATISGTPNTNGNSSVNGETMGHKDSPTALFNHQRDFDLHLKYPIKTLQQEIDLLPQEVNPLRREVHLTHDDFVSLFNMSFWEFDELPVWKKKELKKKYKLF